MKKLKKLSLKKEVDREAEELEKEVLGRKDLEQMTVSEDMEEELFQKIQDYEYEKRTKVVYRKKKKRYAVFVLAAIFIIVFGSVMTGVGSKSYWKDVEDRDEDGEKSSFINVEDMEIKISNNIDEMQVYKEIRSKIGILPAKLIYKPDKMILKNYEIDQELKKATLLYGKEDEIVKYTMYMSDTDSSFGEKTLDKLLNDYSIYLSNKIEIRIKEYEVKNKNTKRYEAEFEYAGAQYEIKGDVEKEEFEKILKNLYFSK